MWQNVKNICKKAKDVVMTVGNRVINKTKQYVTAFLLTFGLTFGFLSPAHSAVPEGVTTAITSAATDVATVGAAVILVHIGIKVWRWIRSAF